MPHMIQLQNSGQVYTPEVFHFKPNGYDHIISTVYPKNVTEDVLSIHIPITQ